MLEFQDQLRDVMFHLAANDKISHSGLEEDLQGGDVTLGDASPGSASKSKGASRKKKAK